MAQDTFYTLLTSLPHIDSLFASKITPISRLQLDKRLAMLSYDDREAVNRVEELMHWSHIDSRVDERSLINLAERLKSQLKSPTLVDLVNWRLDVRTAMAVLRRKRRNQQPPAHSRWSFGNRYGHIRRHWGQPDLGLSGTFPWIGKVADCLYKQDSVGVEKILLEAVWHRLDEASRQHSFDFEAVVIYVLRWNLVARWTAYNGEQALERFRRLTELALGDFACELPGIPSAGSS